MRAALVPILLGTDPDVQSWLQRLGAGGGTVSASTRRAVTKFVSDCKSTGIWPLFRRLNLCVGDSLAASLIPLVNRLGSAADTNANLIASDYSESLGWQGDGATKRIATGYVPTELTGGMSPYLRATTHSAGATIYALMGATNTGSQIYTISDNVNSANANASGNRNACWGSSSTGMGASAASAVTTVGLIHSSRTSATSMVQYRNGVSVASSSTSKTPAAITSGVYVLASNENGTAAKFCLAGTYIAGYGIDSGMTAPQAAAYYAALQAFQTSMGRQV